MLFCYPLDAIKDNWLHDCVVEILRSCLERLNQSQAPLTWPNSIPSQYREKLKRRRGLKDRLKAFETAASSLTVAEREIVLQALILQNSFPAPFDGVSSCPSLTDLPLAVRGPAKDLAKFAFALLSDYELRDQHYRAIYGSLASKTCPFCGCEFFDGPGAPRHDLDHYLPLSKYPFPAANFRNLIPMGDRCNKAYKAQKDIIIDSNGQRRKCYDPYGSIFGAVSLSKSRPFEGDDGVTPHWIIELGPSTESQTWDAVWDIRRRYSRDVLTPEFEGWLAEFAQWCRIGSRSPQSKDELSRALKDWVTIISEQGFSDRAFLKRGVFEMLHDHISSGVTSERLTSFLCDVANPDIGAGV